MGLAEERKPELPKQLQERFRGRRFIDADPPELLEHEGVEILLVGMRADVSEELGIELNPQRETADTAEIFRELQMEKTRHPAEPLLKGEWR